MGCEDECELASRDAAISQLINALSRLLPDTSEDALLGLVRGKLEGLYLSDIYSQREEVAATLLRACNLDPSGDARRVLVDVIRERTKCYALLLGANRAGNKGYADKFEEPKLFPRRMKPIEQALYHRVTFAEFAGNERKTSGSYYTPDSLVQCLLDSALDPVVKERLAGKTGKEAEKALLAIKVCDKAVGSGHFLVGAAHRLARHLARVRALAAGESEPSPLLYQTALRDVIGHCLYGVDINPSRDAFVAELALNHLSQLDHCRDLNAGRLEDVTDAAIGLVERASSLTCQSPERHYACLNRGGTTDPQLLAKRLAVEQFVLKCRDAASPDFRYLEGLTSQPLKLAGKDLKVFCAKLNRGGLEEQAEILRRQTLSAHAALLERADRDENGERVVTQIENVVLAECKEAQLRQATPGQPYGQKMMVEVQDRLKGVAKNDASRVHEQPYEILIGMAGLLTEECTVWWSEKFDAKNL